MSPHFQYGSCQWEASKLCFRNKQVMSWTLHPCLIQSKYSAQIVLEEEITEKCEVLFLLSKLAWCLFGCILDFYEAHSPDQWISTLQVKGMSMSCVCKWCKKKVPSTFVIFLKVKSFITWWSWPFLYSDCLACGPFLWTVSQQSSRADRQPLSLINIDLHFIQPHVKKRLYLEACFCLYHFNTAVFAILLIFPHSGTAAASSIRFIIPHAWGKLLNLVQAFFLS